MINLAPELQLAVVSQLDAREILSLEQVCRALRDLVRGAESAIWKNCFSRYCSQNELFRPSFGVLETTEDFKRAAASGMRFPLSYDRAVATGKPVKFTEKLVGELVVDRDGPYLRNTYLVPGGRFLAVFENDELSFWDLTHETPADTPVFVVEVGNAEKLRFARVAEAEKIQFVFEGIADPYDPEVERLCLDVCDGQVFSYFEVSVSDDGSWSSRSHKQLVLYEPYQGGGSVDLDASVTVCDEMVVLHFQNKTVVWSPADDAYAGWALEGTSTHQAVKVWLHGDHLFYLHSEGIYGVRVPERTAGNGYLAVNALERIIGPSISVAYQHSHPPSLDSGASNIIGFEKTGKNTVLYDVAEFQSSDDGHHGVVIHRHKFTFEGSSPSSSMVEVQRAFTYTHPFPHQSSGRRRSHGASRGWYDLRNGTTAAIWVNNRSDGTGVYLSLTSGDAVSDSQGTYARFLPEDHLDGWKVIEAEMCPASGVALIRWVRRWGIDGEESEDEGEEGSEHLLEIYRFV